MRVAFLGTPDFALPSLKKLVDAGHEVCVFTQPDRPKGRKGELAMPAVKALAQELGLPVFQFEKIRSPESVAALKAFSPDLMVTAAFGQLLSQENLDIPRLGCINVHGSLLPKYRGAAPIQWVVIDGEPCTGVTTMYTDIGLDTGDILLSRKIEIGPDETAGELFVRMAELGAQVLMETIAALEQGTLVRVKQDEALATHCRMIQKEQALVDFAWPAGRIHNLVRGMNPWPVGYALLDGQTVKLWRTALLAEESLPAFSGALPGTCVIADPKAGLFVRTGDGVIEILELQFPGARRMSAKETLLGRPLLGKVFGA